ncbi:MAG: HAD-IIA family hydrolase [Asgard group archaeon]|nr:HAD-IIA family hydrolase [Asgard group archaeon]
MSTMGNLNQKLEIIAGKKLFFFDLDGTIYLGDKLFKGIIELIKRLKLKNKKFFFLSNNSSNSTKDYLQKLKKFNIPIDRENIILSQHPTIDYLKSNNFKKIFLLGTKSLKKEFREEGFILTQDKPEIVVLAFDKELTYDRLVLASNFLQQNIPYIATHLDDRCPTEEGYIPDAGGIAALLKKATGKIPIVFGKPNKEMILFKLKQIGAEPKDAIIFGDRLYTDIKMGYEAGITTCCVLSGETTLDLINKSTEFKPDFIIDGVWDLLNILN